MLENLGKSVVLTGSMIPLEEPVSDAKRNLLVSMMVTAHLNITEVMIFFNTKLIRGNRARKADLWNISAIESSNMEPLAIMGVGIHVHLKNLLHPPIHQFHVHTNLFTSIIVLHITPCFCFTFLQHIAFTWKQYLSEAPAIVLLLYGSGNGPVTTTPFVEIVQTCINNGCTIVIMTQCHIGSVDLTQYEAGRVLSKLGVIDGKDMTVEACVTKLSYLMGHNIRGQKLKYVMETNLRGELSRRSIVSYTGYALGRSGYLTKL
uniref:asparaginase n=1 Tax=Lygus hesperus TaxID=30085 RepID=A0A0A9WHY7_LYGHE